jgi:putative transposase
MRTAAVACMFARSLLASGNNDRRTFRRSGSARSLLDSARTSPSHMSVLGLSAPTSVALHNTITAPNCVTAELAHNARSVDDLVKALGMSGISKSQVSRLCEEIDERVKAFLDRPIEGDWPYLWIDATYVKVRSNGRVVPVAVIMAVGVNADGRREVLGMDIGPSEAETFWTAFLRKLARRGLRGVKLVVSDAHEGLKAAVSKVLSATWQRCRVHSCATRLRMPGEADGASSRPSSPPPSPRTMPRPPRRSGAASLTSSGPRSPSSQP